MAENLRRVYAPALDHGQDGHATASSFCVHKPVNAWRVQSCDMGVIIILGPGLGEREFGILPRAADESVNWRIARSDN